MARRWVYVVTVTSKDGRKVELLGVKSSRHAASLAMQCYLALPKDDPNKLHGNLQYDRVELNADLHGYSIRL